MVCNEVFIGLFFIQNGSILRYRAGSDLLLKALLKETKDQKEMLQNLNIQLSQLREENKVQLHQ